MSVCLILEVSDSHNWPARNFGGYATIPVDCRPTVMQADRPVAEKEALRLATVHPGKRFVVLEAVAMGLSISVPTHVNLFGKVVIEGHKPAVLPIGEVDDFVPY